MIKNIIFDFDGVILDSIPVKTEAFRRLFDGFPEDKINDLVEYHLINGGMSRYKKIKYFFEILLKKTISEENILKYSDKYSLLTKDELSNFNYIIDDSLNFIKNNYNNYNLHIASGADDKDLKYICNKLEISNYFLSINGSPKIKSDIVNDILRMYKYNINETILIGDSKNDYEAAFLNGIGFYGYNNKNLKNKDKYINSFIGFS